MTCFAFTERLAKGLKSLSGGEFSGGKQTERRSKRDRRENTSFYTGGPFRKVNTHLGSSKS